MSEQPNTERHKPLANKGRGRPTNKPVELVERDEKVAYWLLRGHNYKEIADLVGVKSTQTIHASVHRCLAYWRQEMLEDIDIWLAVELEKTLALEAEAWAAWERSQLDEETHRVSKAVVSEMGKVVPIEEQFTTKGQSGDPRFLAMIDKCIDRRCKLLGLYAPERIALTDPTGTEEFGADAQRTLVGRLLSGTAVARAQKQIGGAESE